MENRALLEGMQVLIEDAVYSATEDGERDVWMKQISIIHEGWEIARMTWKCATGEIYYLWVEPSYRRRGLATRMWQEALPHGVKHSKYRSDAGDAWARAVGGELPKRVRA